MADSEQASLVALGAGSQIWAALARIIRERIASELNPDTTEGVQTWQRYRELLEVRNALAQGSTASSLLVPPTTVSETTIDALVQTQDAYVERLRVRTQHVEAVDNHQSRYLSEWQRRVKAHSERSHEDMLSSLWESGLSWRDIARLLKVSVAAVQKWRSGEKMSSKNFARLRDFVAAYDTVASHKPDIDIASWIDVPILTDVPVTPRDLWINGDPNTFFEYALGDLKPETVLDALDPDWRKRYRDDGFETFVGDDGNLSIRTKRR